MWISYCKRLQFAVFFFMSFVESSFPYINNIVEYQAYV